MASIIKDEEALIRFLKAAFERGEISLSALNRSKNAVKGYEVNSDLFDRPSFGLYLAHRFRSDEDPVDMIMKRLAKMIIDEQINLK